MEREAAAAAGRAVVEVVVATAHREEGRVRRAGERQGRGRSTDVAAVGEADRLMQLRVPDVVDGEELDEVDVGRSELALVEPVAPVRA